MIPKPPKFIYHAIGSKKWREHKCPYVNCHKEAIIECALCGEVKHSFRSWKGSHYYQRHLKPFVCQKLVKIKCGDKTHLLSVKIDPRNGEVISAENLRDKTKRFCRIAPNITTNPPKEL